MKKLTLALIIILSLIFLIFIGLGFVLVAKIGCDYHGVLTDKFREEVENQIDLFNAEDERIMCMGEGGIDIKIGGGGRRQVICVTNLNNFTKYNFSDARLDCSPTTCTGDYARIQATYFLNGVKQFPPGRTTLTVATLEVPRDISPKTQALLNFTITKEDGSNEQKMLYLEFVPLPQRSFIENLIC